VSYMRIGLDLDGVTVNSIPTWVRVLNREAGTNFAPDALPPTHSTPELAACSDRHELEMLILPQPMPGAVEALRWLRQGGHSLVVITARSPRLRGLTEAYLAYHDLAVDQLHFLEGGDKAATARTAGIDLLVEDAPHNALAVACAGIPVLLFGAPYNAHVSHPLIWRCAGWSGVLDQILLRHANTGA